MDRNTIIRWVVIAAAILVFWKWGLPLITGKSDNAAQAIPEGRANTNEIHVVTRFDGERVAIEIHDTGSGMPPDVLDRLFTPFFTTKPGGSGIGLALSRQIAEAHGGSLTLANRTGPGCEALLRLPK